MKASAGKHEYAGPKKDSFKEKKPSASLVDKGGKKSKGKMSASKAESREEKEESASERKAELASGVEEGAVLHGMPENSLHEQDHVHEAAGFVSPKTY